MKPFVILSLVLGPLLASAERVTFVDVEPASISGKEHGRKMLYMFGAERLGYVTVGGENVLGSPDKPVPVTDYLMKTRRRWEQRDDVIFHRAVAPSDVLGGYSFDCSNGKILEFWEDAVRLTENRLIARFVGDAALEEKYARELERRGVTSLEQVIDRCLQAKGLVRVAGTRPTKKGVRSFESVNLPNRVTDVFPAPTTAYDLRRLQMEKLGRGVFAFRVKEGQENFEVITWRYLPEDPVDLGFNVYANGEKLNARPLTRATHFQTKFRKNAAWTIREVRGRKEGPDIPVIAASEGNRIEIPLAALPPRKMPNGETCVYSAEEASVGDLDGDGEYEIVLKRSPSNAKDNSQDGYTGETILEGYRLDGQFLWRIDLGKNIRSGAHYTQLLVYDFDGDGKAEIVCKIADGTVDGTGRVLGDGKADWRNKRGRVLKGPEYFAVFEGATGKCLAMEAYDPPRGDIRDWGDDYGNRCDRFLACAAYLDGRHPSFVLCRGYYAKTVLVAWDWDGKKLTKRWKFDSSTPGNEAYGGQGFHNVRIGDIDFDGKDEIVYGSMVLDHDGTGLYSTGFRHGDNMHLVQARPDMRGLQVYTCHEETGDGLVLRDAATGKVVWQKRLPFDVPMCVAADFDPRNPGFEFWMGKNYPIWDTTGKTLTDLKPLGWWRDLVWWKGDLLRSQIERGTSLRHWNWKSNEWEYDGFLDASKAVRRRKMPVFVGDIFGDWREEIIAESPASDKICIFSSPIETQYRFHTFMRDPVYRLSVAHWPICYNQAPQAGFYFGPDLLGHNILFRGMRLR